MRSLLSTLTLLVLSAPALAQPPGTNGQLPEPEAIALIAVAAVGAIVAMRRKKK